VKVHITVNGVPSDAEVEPRLLLVHHLRDTLGLTATNIGCDTTSCGACTVLLDGEAVMSCITPISLIGNRPVRTLEGLGSVDSPSPLQRAFIEEQACQCGYCGNGMVMSAKALLARNPRPTNEEIRKALNGHLCRCASHNRIVRAVQRAAKEMQS